MRTISPWGRMLFVCFLVFFAASGLEAQNRRAVLDRGNAWVTGIPGFGDNALSALYGEYRLDLPAGNAAPEGEGDAGGRRCRIWLSGESLSFSGNAWQARTRIDGVPVFQRRDGEALLAAFAFSGGTGLGSWTAVFRFPQGLAAAGLDDVGADALIGQWLNRFRYFLSLIKSPADLSLPAVIAF